MNTVMRFFPLKDFLFFQNYNYTYRSLSNNKLNYSVGDIAAFESAFLITLIKIGVVFMGKNFNENWKPFEWLALFIVFYFLNSRIYFNNAKISSIQDVYLPVKAKNIVLHLLVVIAKVITLILFLLPW